MPASARPVHAAAVVLLAGVLTVAFPGFSSAVFTARSQSTATVTAADDWTRPTVSLDAVAPFVRGTVPLRATASDERSGVARVDFQLARGNQPFGPLATDDTAPYETGWSTAGGPDGAVSLRATAHDRAGYSQTSAAVVTVVDNTPPTVTMTDPGSAPLRAGSLLASSPADLTSGVARVVFQYAPRGTQDFRALATSTAAPWTAAVPAGVASGRYDLRAVATDRAGNQTPSAVLADRVVDAGPALAGLDIQSYNGPGTARRPDAGDTLVYTFTREVKPSSLIPGWNGSTRNVQYRISGGIGTGDVLDVADAPHLGAVDLQRNYFLSIFGRNLTGTLTASTETLPDGSRRSKVTLQLGNLAWISTREADFADTMTWTPTNGVTDLLDQASATTAVLESGPVDKEF